MDSINESSADIKSNNKYISVDDIEDIQDVIYVHPNINARDTRLKIRDPIRQAQSEWKIEELSVKYMVKGLHKVFKIVVKRLNN